MVWSLFGCILYIHFSGKRFGDMWHVFVSPWELRKSKAVWYGRTEAVRDAAPWAVVYVDPIHCMASGEVFFSQMRELQDGAPINGWKYTGELGLFHHKWSYASLLMNGRGLLCWNGPFLHGIHCWLIARLFGDQVWSSGTRRSTLCCSLSMFSIIFISSIYTCFYVSTYADSMIYSYSSDCTN